MSESAPSLLPRVATAPTEIVIASSPTVVGNGCSQTAARTRSAVARRPSCGLGPAEQQELLAAPARDHVLGPQAALESPDDLDQHLVADPVTVAVVDGLEVVDVEQQQADGRPVGGEQLAQHLVDVPPVGGAGQRVGLGELDRMACAPRRAARSPSASSVERGLQPIVGLALLRDVGEDAGEAHRPVDELLGMHARADPAGLAVESVHAVVDLRRPPVANDGLAGVVRRKVLGGDAAAPVGRRARCAAEQAVEVRTCEQLLVASVRQQQAEVDVLVERAERRGQPPVRHRRIGRRRPGGRLRTRRRPVHRKAPLLFPSASRPRSGG